MPALIHIARGNCVFKIPNTSYGVNAERITFLRVLRLRCDSKLKSLTVTGRVLRNQFGPARRFLRIVETFRPMGRSGSTPVGFFVFPLVAIGYPSRRMLAVRDDESPVRFSDRIASSMRLHMQRRQQWVWVISGSFRPRVSISTSERLADAGIDPSVGTVGDSYDNALAESIIGLFKVDPTPRWDCSTRRMISSFSDAGYLIPRLPHARSCFF